MILLDLTIVSVSSRLHGLAKNEVTHFLVMTESGMTQRQITSLRPVIERQES